MATAPDHAVNVFDFMLVRSASAVSHKSHQRDYVRDTTLSKDGVKENDLFSAESSSAIGKRVYHSVFCAQSGSQSIPLSAHISQLWVEILQDLPNFTASCPQQAAGRRLETIGERNYLCAYQRFFLLPDRLADVNDTLARKLRVILPLLQNPPLSGGVTLDVDELRRRLRELFDGRPLYEAAFDPGSAGHSVAFAAARRSLFDALYVLYIVRRYVRVNLEEIVAAIAALHTLEALAVDEFIEGMRSRGTVSATEYALLNALNGMFPQLAGWNAASPAPGFPQIDSLQSLGQFMSAAPVVHPLFARLHRFNRPFNNVRPIGVGDLKVVKQWLCKYRASDIAYVENVLQGEERTRVHRRLERSEDTSSFSDERAEETQRDTQSTDRFELKREVEQSLKTDLSFNASSNLTYRNSPVVVTLGAGMAFSRAQNDQVKSASNFSREVMEKGVQRVQKRVAQQRTTTRIFETEETNTHGFKNVPGAGHISGLYRWLEKVYRAQVFNYGKRMMFEFVLPEPAAFLVESRMRGFESALDVPRPPTPPEAVVLQMPVPGPGSILRPRFQELAMIYDLSEFEYPTETRHITFVDPANGEPLLKREGLPDGRLVVHTYRADGNARGYELRMLSLEGFAEFQGRNEDAAMNFQRNVLRFHVNGFDVHTYDNNAASWFQPSPRYDITFTPFVIEQDETTLTIGIQDGSFYHFTVRGELHLSPPALLAWQTRVYQAIHRIESEKAEAERQRRQQEYDARLTTYRNRLEQLRAVAINDLLQGQSSAANREVIVTELKRQCISMLAKEFDSEASDDFIGSIDAMGFRRVEVQYRNFSVNEIPNAGQPTEVRAEFSSSPHTIEYPLPRLEETVTKGRHIQFLEQAFEWQQMAWVFYPYFWAKDSKWIEIMNRQDVTDPVWNAFLRAGSVKVLLAVTPAYDDAVLHFLATGEPWEGGPAPVIGDPLYIPIYEELRKQQDDLAGATPEGEPWTFTMPTALVYLENSSTPLPASKCIDLP